MDGVSLFKRDKKIVCLANIIQTPEIVESEFFKVTLEFCTFSQLSKICYSYDQVCQDLCWNINVRVPLTCIFFYLIKFLFKADFVADITVGSLLCGLLLIEAFSGVVNLYNSRHAYR